MGYLDKSEFLTSHIGFEFTHTHTQESFREKGIRKEHIRKTFQEHSNG